MKPPARQTTNSRVARSKDAVLTVTYALLAENGLGGISVDEISRRSGVSKMTIYRHWPSREALLLDACSRLSGAFAAPDTGSFKGDLHALARHLAHELTQARWPNILPSIIDAAERDKALAQLHERLHLKLMRPFVEVMERARLRGELRPGVKAGELVEALVAPFFYRRWFSREPISKQFGDRVAAALLEKAATKA